MTNPTEQVILLEAQLRQAMLAGDLKVLDALLADDLVFTDQTGARRVGSACAALRDVCHCDSGSRH